MTEPTHPYMAAWWPPGHSIGYEHTFTHEVRDLVEAVATGTDPRRPSRTGCRCSSSWTRSQRSAADRGCWTEVEEP